ncbi:uncharacterized protein Z519_04025 [Cladophialophora bantiana CBS 173.52]|uniref:Zn(2)-C6 fungal-type domain-containing protein n=1 Tax=Cladophialophora bantiana (strain ATCC 10958 / CBS 173.52 / CDC B-1940 / NIH 8579) TaxID=1442370 RepID=A0A0D2EZU3_CLAB1|nr:uncharacterized protein Z519_04025 [Cladophialophora bantiana CBS 173.52]KIW95441.1 hypothetical protein Z519_04025 [Cladophialophora bantiana CBS 173.52]
MPASSTRIFPATDVNTLSLADLLTFACGAQESQNEPLQFREASPMMPAHQQGPGVSAAKEDSFRQLHESVETQTRTNGLKPKACNNCRQQKLRCELTRLDAPSSNVCSRCRRLDLDCRVDDTFKRTRKRKKSTELEEEINKLKRQLSVYEDNALTNLAAPSVPDRDSRDLSDPLKNRIFSTTVPVGMSPDSPNGMCLPGATTIPKGGLLDSRSTSKGRVIPSRNLRDVELSKEVINELFRIYFSHYHAYLPFLDPGISPTQYYDSSTLLFWSIISVASRRYQSDPTLLTRLARAVTDLLWKSLQTEPHSLGVIQSLVLLCTWPFPTSSSTTDPTYTLSGMIIQLSIQMGLHRPRSPLDFTKFRVNLSPHDVEDRRRTWIASNIVTQSISFGVGLPTPAQLCDWSIVVSSLEGPRKDEDLHAHLRCASTCNRISQALASNASDPMGLLPTRERLPLYTILNQEIIDLETSRVWTPATTAFYLYVVKLHLHAFYLFDEPTALGYLERIIALYSTATSVVEHVRNLDNQSLDFLRFCPLFCYEAFLCAVFILLKVVKNDYFAAIIDADSGKGLVNFSVSALRKISVVNNDLPGRLSDVIAYLWTHPNPSIIGGIGMDGLQLKVRSRMSMSIVYDSLWRWREQFRTEAESTHPQDLNNDAPASGGVNEVFDNAFDLMELNGIYSDDLQLDWFT